MAAAYVSSMSARLAAGFRYSPNALQQSLMVTFVYKLWMRKPEDKSCYSGGLFDGPVTVGVFGGAADYFSGSDDAAQIIAASGAVGW